MRVLVLYGGESPEREVSLASGKAVVEAAKETGFEVLDGHVRTMKDVIKCVSDQKFDVVFIALHGGWGEDGRLQALLEFYEVPYTGSGPEACMLAMNKALSKYRFRRDDISVPEGIEIDTSRQGIETTYQKVICFYNKLSEEKMVIKPSRCGSTIGISIVAQEGDILSSLRLASEYDNLILAERYIPGKEVTVTVWDDGSNIRAFPVIEIVPKNSLYSYRAKYTPGNSEYLVPAPLQESVASEAKKAAIKAHLSLDCKQYSRADMRLDLNGKPYVLEVNTAPGLTATSLVPKAAKAIGWSFEELVRRLITNALER